MNDAIHDWQALPDHWRKDAQSHLEPGETLVAWFEPDLDERLFYAPGLVLVTDRRLLGAWTPSANGTPHERKWQAWPLTPESSLAQRDQGGAGSLELFNSLGRLVQFRYTAGRAKDASRLVQRHEEFLRAQRGLPTLGSTVCPSCGAVLGADGICKACNPESAAPRVSSLLRLIGYSRSRLGLILLGFLLTVASTTAGLVPPYLTKPLLDDVLVPHQAGQKGDFDLVPWLLGGLLAAAVLAWVLDWGRLLTLNFASEYITADLRQDTYAHLQSLSLEYFGGKRTGDLISRINSDTGRLCNFLSSYVVDFAADGIMIVMTSCILLYINAPLALATLLPFPLIVWLAAWVRGRLLRNFRRAGVAESEVTSILADTIPGIRVVKAFAQEEREIGRFRDANQRLLRANNLVNLLWSFFTPAVSFLTTVGLLVVWGFACYQAYQGTITVGVITLFLAYIARFYGRIESMIRMVTAVQRAAASAQRIFEILDRVPSVPEPVKPVHPGRLEGRIELKSVRFKYGAREVLHGLDLLIEPGEMIGLVGPSGAGKSTLINLVCRFYDVAAGAILVDGVDIRSFPVQEYRQNIGIVLQEPFLFFGTIADNIAYGKRGASREEIVAAARAARAHEFILRLPNGYDSPVGERGQSLSGGERQRISIARALLMDPRLLILDEATSSVDTATEREIQAALENLTRGRTTIAIAHRLSTLRRASRLVVVQQGKIVEVGSHDELIASDGAYARLHRAQKEMTKEHVL